MKIVLVVLFLSTFLCLSGTTFYVAKNGNDNNPGTLNEPFASWQKGFEKAAGGDIVYIRGGVYYASGLLNSGTYFGVRIFNKSGTASNPIKVYAYPGEKPILDGSNVTQSGNHTGISLESGNYWHIKGLEIRNFKEYSGKYADAMALYDCENILIEQCIFHGCGGGPGVGSYCNYIKFLNCDSFDHMDTVNKGDYANGFSANIDAGMHLEYDGCRSWYCSDDGFDFYGSSGYITLNNCWSFNHGYEERGNGAGFKTGASYDAAESGTQRKLTNCVAWNNKGFGFDESQDDHTSMLYNVYNCTSYNNGTGYNFSYEGSKVDIIRNCISYSDDYGPGSFGQNTVDHNSWQNGLVVSEGDFISLDVTGTDGPRQSDGSLPKLNFLRLAPGSDLINKGVNVSLSYGGAAPDLGAFESDIESYVPPTPVFSSSLIANSSPSQLEMTYNTTLASVIPASSSFTVQVNSVARNVTSVSVSGTKVTLTLSSPVIYSDQITVAYAVPASNLLQSSAGQPAEGLSARSVNNNVYPPSPVYINSVVQNSDPSTLEINFNLPLANILPSAASFNVNVNSSARTVSGVSVSGTKLFLKLAAPVAYGNVLTFAYARPSANPLQSTQGGWVSSISPQDVTNNLDLALPAFVSSSIENNAPSVIEINYNLSLAGIIPSASAFTVSINSTPGSVSSVAVSGTKVWLTLAAPVAYGNTVTVAYTKPSGNPLQTPEGGQAASLGAQTVTNRINAPTVVTPPAVVNTPPVVVVSYVKENNAGFVGVLDAGGSFDANKDNLTYTWYVPENIPVSSTTGPVIEFLAPVVSANQTFNFTVTVSDGKAPQSKTVPVEIVPYQPGLEAAEIISVEAAEFQSPDQPDNIIDGNKGTLWSVNGDNQWIILELQALYDIRHVLLSFHPGMNKEFYFDIYGSNDKENWEQILTRTKSCPFSGDLQVFNFPPSKSGKEFRYVKLVGQGNSSDKWNYISEFRIFGYRHKNPADYEQLMVKIYPNPARELVNIVIDEPSFSPDFIKIITLAGKIIYFENTDPDIRHLQIPVNFRQGIYIVQMGKGDLTMFTQKLIVNQ